jgi:hypothetical protein
VHSDLDPKPQGLNSQFQGMTGLRMHQQLVLIHGISELQVRALNGLSRKGIDVL